MGTVRKSLWTVALIAVAMACGCAAKSGIKQEARMALENEIGKMIAEAYPDPKAPGCAVLVRVNGETIFAKGYGVTRLENNEAITPQTNFRLASVTKQFTAACVLKLAESGKLRLDESLWDVFPDFPEYGRKITIRHVLGHTSGMHDYEDLMPKEGTEQILDAGVLELMRAQKAGDFAPGDKYFYSNSGYAVLAMVVEKRSGKRFADFLHDEIFAPLDMADSVAFENGRSEVAHRAYGYKKNDDGTWRFADQSTTSAVLGDGGIYTSVESYAKWADAWFAGKVLGPEMANLAWTRGKLNDGTETEYGCGWRIDVIDGVKHVHHTGSTTGFNNCARLVPEKRMCVIFLSNRNGTEPAALAAKIEEITLDTLAKSK